MPLALTKNYKIIPQLSYSSTDILRSACSLFVHMLLKVVSHDMSVLSMSVMGLKKGSD